MSKNLSSEMVFIGRVLLVLLFLPAGLGKITDIAGTVGYINSVGLPFANLAAVAALLIEILGSLCLLVGYQTRIASMVLAIFTLFATFLFHNYWSAPSEQAFVTQLLFFKNVAVIGGLLILAGQGAGHWSLDELNKHQTPI